MRSRPALLVVAASVGLALGPGCGESDPSGDGPDSELEPPTGTKPEQGPPAFAVGGFHVELPPITLAPGEEAFPCFIAPLEVEGPSTIVGGGSVTVGKGMHHGNITSRPKTGEGLRPCPEDEDVVVGEAADILKGGAVLFGSTTQVEGTEWRRFPDGMGFPVTVGHEIVMRMHYLNPTQEELTVTPKYDWYTIDEAKLVHLLGPVIWRYSAFEIPPHSDATVTAQCTLPTDVEPMHLVDMMPHMHKLGKRFVASFIGGELDQKSFLDTPGYNPDGLISSFDPAVEVAAGNGFSFACTWENTFDKTIVEGTGDNEMCMMFGYAYPYESAFSAFQGGDGACIVLGAPPRAD